MSSDRLNLGCGDAFKRGYINVDLYSDKADFRMDVTRLDFLDEVFQLVEARHVIEHLGYVGSIKMLSEAYRALKNGGMLIIETPDIEKSFAEFLKAKNKTKKAKLLNWIYGLEYPGYYHRFCFPKEALTELLGHIGFDDIQFITPKYRTFPSYCIKCRKPVESEPHETYSIIRRFLPLKNDNRKEYLDSLNLEKIVIWKSLESMKKFVITGKQEYYTSGLESFRASGYLSLRIKNIFATRLGRYAKK